MTTPMVSAPTFEHLPSGLGIGVPTPRLSFKISGVPGWEQLAYEIEVERGDSLLSSGCRVSSESVLVDWPFEPVR